MNETLLVEARKKRLANGENAFSKFRKSLSWKILSTVTFFAIRS